MHRLHKKSIIQKTIQVGSSTIMSRMLGVIREIALTNYLGPGMLFDAFVTAFKIPNSLRKIFAEGALSAAFVPTIVTMIKAGDKKHINTFMTRSLLIIEGLLLGLCLLIFIKADSVIRFIVPGWFVTSESGSLFGIPVPAAWLGLGTPLPSVSYAITFLRILIAFIIFISSSALLASALQAVNHFFVPAFSPVLLNIFFIAGALVGWYLNISPEILCVFILLGGIVQFLIHLVVYWHLNFRFSLDQDPDASRYFMQVMKKFLPCLFTMSMMEISLFIDTSFASYLPAGSISLIYLANRFMGIALGVFAVAFSTILLPHFSRISTYAPKRLNYYLLESTKLVLWVTLPVIIMMSFLSEKIFITLFSSKKFSAAQTLEASHILIAFLIGLFFFSLNKIILNVYYALHNTRTPTFISLAATITNIVLNMIFITKLQATGLALATTLAGILQTILLASFLYLYFNFHFYLGHFATFAARFCLQLLAVLSLFFGAYYIISTLVKLLPPSLSCFFLESIGFWAWVTPLCALVYFALYYTRHSFGISMHFLD